MNAEEKLLFKERYDEISHDGMELGACYELIEELPIDADTLIEELEEWESYKDFTIDRVILNLDETIEYSDWDDFFYDLKEFLQTNINSFTEYVENEYEDTDIEEALEDEEIIEEFLHEAIILENYELITKSSLKELQQEMSVSILENYADTYLQTKNYLCIKNFQYTIIQ